MEGYILYLMGLSVLILIPFLLNSYVLPRFPILASLGILFILFISFVGGKIGDIKIKEERVKNILGKIEDTNFIKCYIQGKYFLVEKEHINLDKKIAEIQTNGEIKVIPLHKCITPEKISIKDAKEKVLCKKDKFTYEIIEEPEIVTIDNDMQYFLNPNNGKIYPKCNCNYKSQI